MWNRKEESEEMQPEGQVQETPTPEQEPAEDWTRNPTVWRSQRNVHDRAFTAGLHDLEF